MTFDSIWLQLCEKNNLLIVEESVVEFRSKNLKALLLQVYQQGQKNIPKAPTSREAETRESLKSKKDNDSIFDFDSFFGSIFGKK